MRIKAFLSTLALLASIAPAYAQRDGGTASLVLPYGASITTLDIHSSARAQDGIVSLAIHRGLYSWSSEKNEPVLELATSVSVSPDGMVYTYKLRDNIRFHNGRKMTAGDVIWSYQRVLDPKGTFAGARYLRIIAGAEEFEAGKAKSISGLEAVDDVTLRVTLKDRVDPAQYLFWPEVSVLPSEEVERPGFANAPVGLGPFRFASMTAGSRIVVDRFDDFYKGKPHLDHIIYNIMGEAAARDVAFRAKTIDINLLGSAQYPVYKNDPEFSKNIVEVAEYRTRFYALNPRFKPFQDKRVRQAINYAINSEVIISKLVKDKAYRATGWLPLTSSAYNPDIKGYPYDPEKAKQLLKEAGYEKGFTVELVTTNNESFGSTIVEATIPFLAKVGITVKPKVVENAVGQDLLFQKGDFDAAIWSLASGPDPLAAMKRFHSTTSRAGGNIFDYKNKGVDALIDAASAAKDKAEQTALLKKVDAVIVEDAPIWLFNYNKAVLVHQPWLKGVQTNAVELTNQYPEYLWLDDTSPRANAK
ncbi:ABC transporter substrate-binding protein [Bosea sp. 2YAB26]|uniref:ABC transporter substrate-binding protein n=1 Tax=Bosea sp. 2YAB26 TaxID=3237478 RepID=UPI003F8EA663